MQGTSTTSNVSDDGSGTSGAFGPLGLGGGRGRIRIAPASRPRGNRGGARRRECSCCGWRVGTVLFVVCMFVCIFRVLLLDGESARCHSAHQSGANKGT